LKPNALRIFSVSYTENIQCLSTENLIGENMLYGTLTYIKY